MDVLTSDLQIPELLTESGHWQAARGKQHGHRAATPAPDPPRTMHFILVLSVPAPQFPQVQSINKNSGPSPPPGYQDPIEYKRYEPLEFLKVKGGIRG